MLYGEKLRRVNVRKSRGREFVVEVPKMVEPDETHKTQEEFAARAAGLNHTNSAYKDDKIIREKLSRATRLLQRRSNDAIAGAHILSALHLLYGVYHRGENKGRYSAEELAKKIGHVVDRDDESQFKKAVGIVEWLSGKYPKEGQVILPPPDEVERNIDDIATKIAADLGATTPEEKEMIKKYILSATKIGRTIANAIEAKNPSSESEIKSVVERALQMEQEAVKDLYLIRRKIAEMNGLEDPHHSYPKQVKRTIEEIERRKKEEEELRKKKEIEKKKRELEELVNQFVNRKDQRDALKEKIAQELKEIEDPSFVEELARKYPEWAKEYVELALEGARYWQLPDKLIEMECR